MKNKEMIFNEIKFVIDKKYMLYNKKLLQKVTCDNK